MNKRIKLDLCPTIRAAKRRLPHHARLPLNIALAAAMSLGLMAQAEASKRTWTGAAVVAGGPTAQWSNSHNWNVFGISTYIPILNGDSLFFDSTKAPTQLADVNAFYTGISFGANATGFTFNQGNNIGIWNEGISNGSSKTQVFNVRVDAYGEKGDQSWDGGSAGMNLSNAWLGGADTTLTLKNKVSIQSGIEQLGANAGDALTLNIMSGSSATLSQLTLARDNLSQGTILVDGLLSKLTNSGDLVVGLGATGTITVQNGGTLNSGNSFIGKATGGDGLLQLTGATSSWVSTGNLNIGDAGVGSLRVEAGAKFSNVGATLGSLAGGAGTAKVTGANSSWLLSGDLTVGKLGEGSLFIEQGGLVSNQHTFVGLIGDAGTSKLVVTGASSRLQSSGNLTVQSGSLEIADGGLVNAKNAYFGAVGGTSALVDLGGTGSTLSLTDNLVIGSETGSATLNLSNGAILNSGSQLIIGKGGVLNLNGGTLNVGWSKSAGQVNFNTGTINFLGSQFTGDGILDHSVGLGAGMNINVKSELRILAGDNLTLNGGNAQTQSLTVLGELAVGNFSQLVVGAGGLNNTGAVQMAGGKISSAGTVLSSSFLGGYGVIAGAGGFSNTGLLRQSGGSLELATLGSNINTGNWDMLDGRGLVLSGANLLNAGVMSMSGDTVSGSATLINGTAGTLTGRGVISAKFQNAGRMTVDAGSFRIDQNFRNDGQILMGSTTATMAGGTITNAGRIIGAGQINNEINNTGTVGAVGGTLTLDGKLSNNGIISAGRDATVLMNRGLGSNTGKIQLSGGGFDNNGFAMSNEVGAVINGFGSLSGGLLSNKGKILLSGGSSTIYADLLNSSASQIVLSGLSNNTFYGKLDVQSGAELRVSTGSVATFFGDVQQRTGSKFTGAGAKRFEGTLTIGASPGLGTDEGDVEFGESSSYLAEIGGISACTLRCGSDEAFKNSSFDKYIVAGNLSLNGTLKLTSWNGFVAQKGQSFDLLDWGTLTGTFADIDASGFKLAAGTQLDFSQLYTNGSISVTVAAVPEPASLALWLAGLGALGSVVRRRRLASKAG
ncbi:beta strand repeat-containing protein [Roseateles albus]|uniref:PEP-CTERM sorting domain-containing protein n=1 Tax=Roseateles albus TaxID=2987525 RepID=A0ABT5K7N7_9BURK|nr:PEP-CTERM sorting domain-containing protein [Roseateles albus]MDC8769971.1 PEP-CTERM sorting domain-containing protein [Roseateles albus]